MADCNEMHINCQACNEKKKNSCLVILGVMSTPEISRLSALNVMRCT